MRLGRLVYWWCTANYLVASILGGVWYITSNDPELDGGKPATKISIEGIRLQDEWPAFIEKTLLQEDHPDIDVRGKVQQERINDYCHRYNSPGGLHFPTSDKDVIQFRRHLLFDDQQRIVFCFIPKVGCTNMKRLMLYMSGKLPMETLEWKWVEDNIYLEPALQQASFLNRSLTDSDRMTRLQSYYKFVIVRNPLERIVSAFRNKVEPPLKHDPKSWHVFPEKHKFEMLQRYRPDELLYWQNMAQHKKFNISVTFSEFIRYLVDTDWTDLQEHFQPQIQICHPCLVRYHFYGSFRNYSSDVAQLIKKFKTDPKFYRDESLHNSSEQTNRYLAHYYNKLPHREKLQLLGRWYDELAFYYTLYPSEKFSHFKLLGIHEVIL